ncbi:MAG: hypothetical protein FJ297_01195 [Planctomycetes bacterium]|nr:hypothetical protein [Planctomycetota bacterium]
MRLDRRAVFGNLPARFRNDGRSLRAARPFALLVLLFLAPRIATAQQASEAEPEVHTFVEWESFGAGSWKQARIYRETFGEGGKLIGTSIADAKTTLQTIDERGFTLRADVTVEVAGRRFAAQPQVAWHGFHGESEGQVAQPHHAGQATFRLNGQAIPVDVFRITTAEGDLRRDTEAQCGVVFPHLFRKQSILIDPSGGAAPANGGRSAVAALEKDANPKPREIDRVLVEVIATDLPHRVLSEWKPTAHVRTVRERPDARTVTLEVHCEEVPGRVVAHWSAKTDAAGRLIERSTLELTAYGMGSEPADRPIVRRPFFRRR